MREADVEVAQVDTGTRDQRDLLAGCLQFAANDGGEAQDAILLACILDLRPVAESGAGNLDTGRRGAGRRAAGCGCQERGG